MRGRAVAGTATVIVQSEETFPNGNRVTWRSHGSTAVGTVEREHTSDTEASGRTVRASKDEPRYEVRTEKSGRSAVHRPGALTKRD